MFFLVPPQHVAVLKRWLELPGEGIEQFSAALEKTKPHFNAPDLAAELIPLSELPPDLVRGIVELLISVYRTGEPEKPIETFLDRDVKLALTHTKVFSEGKEHEEWGRLRKFFLHALSLERVIGTTAKAGPVLTEHERIFQGARVLTDFRPIFHIDVSEKPNAGLIIHMLKITQRDKYDKKTDAYYAMDSNDVAALKQVLDRALEKEKALHQTMNDAGLTVLDVKAYY